jgi:thiol-disulfide isomerase/thioredoxin
MKFTLALLFVLTLASCKEKQTSKNFDADDSMQTNQIGNNAQNLELEVYDFNGFKKFLNQNDDKIHVINFWATWCAPCVKELPYFEKLSNQFADKNVEVVLVSLDFPHLYESKLKPFIAEHHLKAKVIALDDVDMNSWIPQVNRDWSGSIPATIIYKNDDSKFFEQSLTYEILENEILKFLK